MYPIKLEPVFKEIVWGGNRLKADFGYKSELENIAEAWVTILLKTANFQVFSLPIFLLLTKKCSAEKAKSIMNFRF